MAASDPALPGTKLKLIVVLCFLVATLEGYDLQVMAVAGPLLRKAMGLSPQQLGIALSASFVGLAFGAAFGGALGDRVGRRRVLLFSVIALGLFTMATSLVTAYSSLLGMRVLTGVAVGGAMPNLIATIASSASKRDIITYVSMMICGFPAGGIVAALAGHAIADRFGWPGLFLLGGALTLVVATALTWLPETRSERASHQRTSYAAALFGEGRTAATLLLWTLFILTLALLSLFSGWAPALVIAKGLPQSAAFSVMIALNLGGIAGTLIIGRICDLWGVRNAMLCIYVGMAISLALFAWSRDTGTLLVLAGVAGFFVLGAQFALYGVAPRLYPAANHGAGVGAAVAAGRIGSVLGPIIAGQLMGAAATGDEVLLSTAPVALLAGLVVVALAAASGASLQRVARSGVAPA